MAEHPLASLYRAVWRDLFERAGYTHNARRRARPRLPRQLYRGADARPRDGWSWTDDRRAAEWFARRSMHSRPGVVWTAMVEPVRLLARLTNIRDEDSGRS